LKTLNQTYAAFNALGSNLTVGAIEGFVNTSFVSRPRSLTPFHSSVSGSPTQKGEGLELEQVAIEGFNSTPKILSNISDPVYKGWVSVVNGYWTLLVRWANPPS
jgi:alpha,alpha-trehalase